MKALLIDGEGREQGSAIVATPFHGGEMAVDGLVAAVRELCGALGERCGRAAAVGIAGIAESGAPLDGHGQPLAPVIVWHDPRGAEVVDRLLRHLGPDLERAIGQRLRTVSGVAKLGWLLDHGVGPVARWLGVPELALQALTGSEATEFSLAARTGAYDVATCRYLPEVAAVLGVATEVFPTVARAGAVMGRVSPGAAGWSRLPEGIPVTVAGHDHLAGRAGSGADPEDVVNSVGTAETVIAGAPVLPDRDRAISLRVAVTVAPGGQGWALLASAARSGVVIDAVAAALGRSAPDLDREAHAGPRVAVDDGVIDAALRGDPIDLPRGAPGAVWNGVLHALATRAWEAVDRLEQASRGTAVATHPGGAATHPGGAATHPGGLVVFGGGSRSLAWMAAKAAARPGTAVWRSGAPEAVARGAAVYAGVAAGWWSGPDAAPQPARERIATGCQFSGGSTTNSTTTAGSQGQG